MAALTLTPVIVGPRPPSTGKSYYGDLLVFNNGSFELQPVQTSPIMKTRCIFKLTPFISIHKITTDKEYFVIWVKMKDYGLT